MVAALTMITGSVERRLRGGFMSANSAVQHLASGLGAYIGGQIVVKVGDGPLLNFSRVGLLAAVATALSLWIAGRLRPAAESNVDLLRCRDHPPGDVKVHAGLSG
jgi:predicted MFS family arabinose efflux permease